MLSSKYGVLIVSSRRVALLCGQLRRLPGIRKNLKHSRERAGEISTAAIDWLQAGLLEGFTTTTPGE
ncbi:MAG: hypothetical protein O7E57_06965 [Gammaproteobacteria bacterium]|nr:hypothetical protein [Gammaproteobacteria bacterium]